MKNPTITFTKITTSTEDYIYEDVLSEMDEIDKVLQQLNDEERRWLFREESPIFHDCYWTQNSPMHYLQLKG